MLEAAGEVGVTVSFVQMAAGLAASSSSMSQTAGMSVMTLNSMVSSSSVWIKMGRRWGRSHPRQEALEDGKHHKCVMGTRASFQESSSNQKGYKDFPKA